MFLEHVLSISLFQAVFWNIQYYGLNMDVLNDKIKLDLFQFWRNSNDWISSFEPVFFFSLFFVWYAHQYQSLVVIPSTKKRLDRTGIKFSVHRWKTMSRKIGVSIKRLSPPTDACPSILITDIMVINVLRLWFERKRVTKCISGQQCLVQTNYLENSVISKVKHPILLCH